MTGRPNEPLLLVRLDGPEVRGGRIPLSDLVLFGRHLQSAVYRVARVLLGDGRSVRPGKKPKGIESSCTLEVVAFQPGSFQMSLDLPRDQLQFEDTDLGVQALEHLIAGIDGLASDRPTLPAGYDEGVLFSWREAGKLLDHGLDKIEFRLNTHRAPQVAFYTTKVHHRVVERILEPVQNQRSFEGRLLMADFRETGRRCRLNLPTGESIPCSFDDAKTDLILAGLLQHVRVTGEAEIDAVTGKIERVRIEDLEVLENGSDYGLPTIAPRAAGFWSGQSIEALAEEQGVRPVARLEQLYGNFWPEDEDINEALDHIYERRRLDRDRGTH